jgi:hypothetical protein
LGEVFRKTSTRVGEGRVVKMVSNFTESVENERLPASLKLKGFRQAERDHSIYPTRKIRIRVFKDSRRVFLVLNMQNKLQNKEKNCGAGEGDILGEDILMSLNGL